MKRVVSFLIIALYLCLNLATFETTSGQLVVDLDDSCDAEIEDITKRSTNQSNIYTVYVKFTWKVREKIRDGYRPYMDKYQSGLATTKPMVSDPALWGGRLKKEGDQWFTFWTRLPNQGPFSVWECKLQRNIEVPLHRVLISEDISPKPDPYHSYRETYIDLGSMGYVDVGGKIGKLAFHSWEIDAKKVQTAVDRINTNIKALTLSSVDRNSRTHVKSTFTLTVDAPSPRETISAYLKTSYPTTVDAAMGYLKPYKYGKLIYEGTRVEVLVLAPSFVKLLVTHPHYHFAEGAFKVESDLEKTVYLSDIGTKIRIEKDGKGTGSFIE